MRVWFKILSVLFLAACGLIWLAAGAVRAEDSQLSSAPEMLPGDDLASEEPLQAEPVGPLVFPSGEEAPYPIATSTPTPTPTPESEPLPASETWSHQFYPYAPSAYLPPLDWTEVDLGLILLSPPGLSANLRWGAMSELSASAELAVQGSSHTAGVGLQYGLRSEEPADTRPALAAKFGWRYLNHRTHDEIRSTLFRGNRVQLGALVSKDLGSLARALETKPETQSFLERFRFHAELLLELQVGRERAEETGVTRLEMGTRLACEMIIDPRWLWLTVAYDSLPDWIGTDEYYVGVRYLTRPDFALDGIAGKMGGGLGLTVGLAWLF
ncbi:MAG: hypothetical protein AB1439_08820 [candidate division FCPU426 bacterium]